MAWFMMSDSEMVRIMTVPCEQEGVRDIPDARGTPPPICRRTC